jgi:hypothetical protein
MIGGSKRLLQALGTVLTNRHEAIRQAGALFATDPIETLANGCGHRRGHGFSRQPRKLFSQAMSFRVFDVQAHLSTILPYISTVLPHTVKVGKPHRPRSAVVQHQPCYPGILSRKITLAYTGPIAVFVDELDAAGFRRGGLLIESFKDQDLGCLKRGCNATNRR